MPRTHTLAERNAVKAAIANHYLWVEVENADRSWIELTALEAIDWLDEVEIKNSIDQPCPTFTLNLRRADTDAASNQYSMAPTWGGSPLNRNNAGAYAPLLDVGRNVRIYVAVVGSGVVPGGSDKHLLLHGRIDNIEWGADPVVATGRGLEGWLINTQIEAERAYATDAPTLLEVVMQSILNAWPSGVVAVPTLNVPVSPAVVFNNAGNPPKTQAIKSVLEALQQDWALSIGWVCRYLFDDTSGDFLLTFYDIDRTNTTPSDSFAPTEYKDITSLNLADDFVRNRITGSCYGSAGNLIQLTVEDLVSQAKYGKKWAAINLPIGDQIDDSDKLGTLVNAALSDLKAPFATQTMLTLLYWMVELGDLYTFVQNTEHYDSDQLLAVVGYTHTFKNGEGWTQIDTRGNVVGAYHAWFKKLLSDPTSMSDASLGLNKFDWDDTDTVRTYSMVAGANVERVFVYVNTLEAPPLFDPWPSEGVLPTIILTPDPITRVVSYAVNKPDAKHQTYIQFEPRRISDDTNGETKQVVLDPNPRAQTATLHGIVTNATVDVSCDVKAGTADWPVTVDIRADSPLGTILVTKIVNANVTLDKTSVGCSALGGLSLPQREARRFFVTLTNVAGEVTQGEPIAVDRDALPVAFVTITDFRSAPIIKVNYDDDTDQVKIYIPGGKTKTFSALSGAGTVTYTVGDATDDASSESAMAIDESRTGYQVDIHGGGQYLTAWGGVLQGVLHGQTTGPSLTVQVTPHVSTYDIAYSGTGTITYSTDGGATFTTPPASPLTGIARDATTDKTFIFKCVQAGQTIVDVVVIPSLQKDAITPDLTVTPGTPTTTQQPFTVASSNSTGGTAPTITVTPFNCSMVIGGVTFSTAQVVATGTVVTALRPSTVTDTQAHISFVSTIAGGGTEAIDVEIVSQLNFGPTLNVQATPGATPGANYSVVWSGTGTIVWSVNGAAYTTPTASPVAVGQDATLDKTIVFKATKDGQDIVCNVTIPSIQSDAMTPSLVVVPGTMTATTIPYTASFGTARGSGTAPTAIAQVYGSCSMVIGGTTYVAADGAQSIVSGTVVTVNRAASTTNTKDHVRFRAAIAGGGAEDLIFTVPPQLNVGPSLTVTPTPGDLQYTITWSGSGTITYSVDGASYTTPPSSPFTFNRDAADHTLIFKAVADGQTVTTPAMIPKKVIGTGGPDISAVSFTPTNQPCDGGGGGNVNITEASMPGGQTYDIQVFVDGGTRGAHGPYSWTGIAAGSFPLAIGDTGLSPAIDMCGDSFGRINIIAKKGGSVLASANSTWG